MAQQYRWRGTEARQESTNSEVWRDTRPMGARAAEWMGKQENLLAIGFAVLAAGWFFASVMNLAIVFLAGLAFWASSRKEQLPYKKPVQESGLDHNEINPGTGRPSKPEGILFVGNELDTGKEVWMTASDAKQHMLVMGTTGAGKTELMLGIATNALTWNSGFIFIDGKGDASLVAKVISLARRFGREDDVHVVSFLTANKDNIGDNEELAPNTHTLNPLANGSSDALIEMLSALMSEGSGNDSMWRDRARNLLSTVIRALVWMRNEGLIQLDVNVLRKHLNLDAIIELADPNYYQDMPKQIRDEIIAYLHGLSGFDFSKGKEQPRQPIEQHGYLQMQFTQMLSQLAGTYGHIFKTPTGSVDMMDVVLRRRILVVVLPSLEKSKDETAALGKIVAANIKGMMAGNLSSASQGAYRDVVDNRAASHETPYVVIYDEVGYYLSDGMGAAAAQSRSLNFCNVFGGQDKAGLEALNKTEAARVIANTNTKIGMRIEDAFETSDLLTKTAGNAMLARVRSFQRDRSQGSMTYYDQQEATFEKSERVDFLDLKNQKPGDIHFIVQDRIVRAKSFYAAPERSFDVYKVDLRIPQYLSLDIPTPAELERELAAPKLKSRLLNPDFQLKLKSDADKARAALKEKDDLLSNVALFMDRFAAVEDHLTVACGAFGSLLASEVLSGNRDKADESTHKDPQAAARKTQLRDSAKQHDRAEKEDGAKSEFDVLDQMKVNNDKEDDRFAPQNEVRLDDKQIAIRDRQVKQLGAMHPAGPTYRAMKAIEGGASGEMTPEEIDAAINKAVLSDPIQELEGVSADKLAKFKASLAGDDEDKGDANTMALLDKLLDGTESD